jgi:hypothetical protein
MSPFPMIDRKSLLTALQRWVKQFENDLRERCKEMPELDASLRGSYVGVKRAGRTAESYELWRDGQLTQVAVSWVLACVFVRFLEDNGLLDHPWIAGAGDRRTQVEHVRDRFFSQYPTLSDREYLQHVFSEVGNLPGMADLFERRHNPLWGAGLSGDAASEFIAFWRKMEYDFTDPTWDTRFLGDLYQDLSETARKQFALLQTPVFVTDFILDRTLGPAIETFGYEHVRMIDPACGSGHFILGGFARLLCRWQSGHPELNERELVMRALQGVAGVDINPFAVAIARFRLLLEAWRACGITRLRAAPDFQVNLDVGDSLLHGRRFRDEALTFIKGGLDTGKSRGAYLHGSFGSGKSHFMGVLNLLLQGNLAARSIPELAGVVTRHDAWLAGKKFLIVPYHMIGAASLESAIFNGYVQLLRESHSDAPTPAVFRAQELVTNADRIREHIGDDKFIAELNKNKGTGAEARWGALAAGWTISSYASAKTAGPSAEDYRRLVGDLIDVFFPSIRREGEFVRIDEGLSVISRHAKGLGYDALIAALLLGTRDPCETVDPLARP